MIDIEINIDKIFNKIGRRLIASMSIGEESLFLVFVMWIYLFIIDGEMRSLVYDAINITIQTDIDKLIVLFLRLFVPALFLIITPFFYSIKYSFSKNPISKIGQLFIATGWIIISVSIGIASGWFLFYLGVEELFLKNFNDDFGATIQGSWDLMSILAIVPKIVFPFFMVFQSIIILANISRVKNLVNEFSERSTPLGIIFLEITFVVFFLTIGKLIYHSTWILNLSITFTLINYLFVYIHKRTKDIEYVNAYQRR